jgi:LCP family protein required for cell wall assembly
VALTPASWRVFRRRFVVACAAALAIMVASIVVLNVKVNQTLADTKRIGNLTFPDGPAEGGNYLVIGSDSRSFVTDEAQKQAFGSAAQEGGQRADVMMVLHVDPAKKTNLLVSFPRDLLVTDPTTGHQVQINGLFNNGPQAVIDMLSKNFGVEVHHFVQINFEAFIGVVDAVGKIPVYFPYNARDTFSGLNEPAGCQALDGNSALAYVRSRHLQYDQTGTGHWSDASPRADLDRISRQQDFIRKLASFASAKAGQNPLDALDIANAIVPKLLLDKQLSKDNILRLVKTFRNVDPKQQGALEMVTLPNVASSRQPGRLDVQQPEAEQLLARLRTFGGETGAAPTVREADVVVGVLNGSGKNGLAGTTLPELQLRGFGPGPVGNAPPAAKTLVRYAPGASAKAELVARYLGGVGQLIDDPSIKDSDVIVVIGADWRGVHGKGKTVQASSTTTTTVKKTSSTTAKGQQAATGTQAAAC